MFNWFETVRAYYNAKLYTAAQVGVFASAGWITAEQAATIIAGENT